MTRQSLTRSIFPAYTPPDGDRDPLEHQAAYLTRWAKRVVVVAASVGALVSALAALGFRGPNTTTRLAAVEDSSREHGRRIDNVERLERSTLYVSCQTLLRVQPKESIPPQECALSGVTP